MSGKTRVLLALPLLLSSCLLPDEIQVGTAFADHPPWRRFSHEDVSFVSYGITGVWYVKPREVKIVER